MFEREGGVNDSRSSKMNPKGHVLSQGNTKTTNTPHLNEPQSWKHPEEMSTFQGRTGK